MTIPCGLCSKTMIVAEDLVEGQHVRCPFCHGKFSYVPLPLRTVERSNPIGTSVAEECGSERHEVLVGSADDVKDVVASLEPEKNCEGRKTNSRASRRARGRVVGRRRRKDCRGSTVRNIVLVELGIAVLFSAFLALHVQISSIRNKWAADRVHNAVETRKMVIQKSRTGVI